MCVARLVQEEGEVGAAEAPTTATAAHAAEPARPHGSGLPPCAAEAQGQPVEAQHLNRSSAATRTTGMLAEALWLLLLLTMVVRRSGDRLRSGQGERGERARE